MNAFESMARSDLLRALQMFAKNWLAHDGCWFLAVEERLGMDAAIELDARSWARFAATEVRRIMETFAIPLACREKGGHHFDQGSHHDDIVTGVRAPLHPIK